jgi:hypothetical protein
MLGGMWGYQVFRNRKLANKIVRLIKNFYIAKKFNSNGKSEKDKDQLFLKEHIWNNFAIQNSMTHASYFCDTFGGSNIQAFTIQRPKIYCFVTCSLCCDVTKNNNSWPLDWTCPIECRPKHHSDWEYC